MTSPSIPNNLIVFHYPWSPPSRQVLWYLAFAEIAYAQCVQPNLMPRPDLEYLGVNYRRIPLMSVGRDIYCDSRLILRELQSRFNTSDLAPSSPEEKAIIRLLEKWLHDVGVFGLSSALLPRKYFAFQNERFLQDREDMTGRSFNLDNWEKGYPEARVRMQDCFDLLETTLLADGREWLLGTSRPSLADISCVWPFHWLICDIDMSTALPAHFAERYPKVFAWVHRFQAAAQAATVKAPTPVTVNGKEALEAILECELGPLAGTVDENDPSGLKSGQDVNVYPMDSGYKHKDRGALLALNSREAVILKKTAVGNEQIRIHVPRWGFKVLAVKGLAGKL